MAASGLNVAFAKSIPRCLSTVSCAVNTRLTIASDIESTSLLCLRSSQLETSTTNVLIHEAAHSTGVSLDETVVRLRCIPRQLPVHPTAIHPIVRRQSCFS